jgi:hypothetical protein
MRFLAAATDTPVRYEDRQQLSYMCAAPQTRLKQAQTEPVFCKLAVALVLMPETLAGF